MIRKIKKKYQIKKGEKSQINVEEIKGGFKNNEKYYDLIYNGKKIINVTVDKEMNKPLAFAILNDLFVKNGFPKKNTLKK